jgi:hypothetical protein
VMLTVKAWSPEKADMGEADGVNRPAGNSPLCVMGREKEARTEAAEVLRINPKFSLESWKKRQILKDQSVTDTFCDALRKAGIK